MSLLQGVGGPSAVAAPGDGPITVNVIRDVNGNGSHEPDLEPGLAGMDVVVDDNDGGSLSTVTDEAGVAVIDPAPLTGSRYRVRVVIPDERDHLQPAPAGGLDPMTSYVDVADGAAADLTVGVWNPVDYVQPDPDYAVGVHSNLGLIDPPDPVTSRAVQRYKWTDRFAPVEPDPGSVVVGSDVAAQPDVGTTFGLAYQRESGDLFMAPLAKRHASYGPEGPGAIYVTPGQGPSDPFLPPEPPELFTVVPDAGSTPHSPDLLTDFEFWDAPGKEGLGGIDLSADGTELYVVNLNDRQLYTYDATQPTADAPMSVVPIPDPGCNAPGDWRPFAVTVRDGVFVGGVCSGESLGQGPEARTALEAVVYDWDGADSFTEVLRKTLDFQRGFTSLGFVNDSAPEVGQGRDTHWNSWIPEYDADNVATGLPYDIPGVPGSEVASVSRPQPILSSIAFDVDGSMILGFRDRFGDQTALGLPLPPKLDSIPPVAPMPAVGTTGGDINKACANPDGSYSWEGTGGCPDNYDSNPLIGGAQLPGTAEYFPGDWALGVHHEASQGAVQFPLQQQELISTMLDPNLIPFSGGIGFYDRDTGSTGFGELPEDSPFGPAGGPAGIDPRNGNTVTWALFGKSNGLGGLELLAEAAPVQTGGRTWFDENQDGIQDPAEPALPGVTATLIDPEGAPVSDAISDDQGLYYFGPDEVLDPDTPYTIAFDYTTADTSGLPGAPDPTTLSPSPTNAGDDPVIDSDPGPDGTAPAPTGPSGTSDQTVDAGAIGEPIEPPVDDLCAVGDFVWDDTNGDGIQDDGEPGIEGVTVTLLNPDGSPAVDPDGNPIPATTTDANGAYLFDNIACGDYLIRFSAPDGKTFSAAGQGDDPAVDSNPDPAGEAPVTVGPDDPDSVPNDDPGVSADFVNPTIDAGVVDAVDGDGVVGDFVWLDANEDGIQDPDEPGVQDATATLFRAADDSEVGSTTTDAGGNYAFTGLDFDDYYVVFEPPVDQPDLTPTTQSATGSTPDNDSNPDDTGQTPTFPVDASTTPEDSVDAGYVDTVAPDAPVITSPEEGEVVTDDTPTIEGTGEPGSTVTVDVTDADGNTTTYEAPVADDGTWSVTTDPLPDGPVDVVATQTDPAGNTSPPTERSFEVDTSAPSEERVAVGDFVWDDTNGDGIQDAGEPGVEGVTVELLNPDGSPASDADGAAVPAATTDADGRYLVDNLASGDYMARFAAPTGRTFTAQAQGGDPAGDSNPDASGDTPVFTVSSDDPDTVADDDPNTNADFINATIDAGLVDAQDGDGVVGDFVWLDVNEDGIQDPDEPGVQDATVTLFRAADDSEVGSTTTDAGGSYAFGGLDFDDYYVVFEAPVDQPDLEPTVQSAGDDPAVDSDPDDTGQTPVFTVDETTTPEDMIDAGYIDQVAPVVEITSPSEGETTGDSTPTIEGTVDDPGSTVDVVINDQDGNPVFEGPATVNDDGTWSVTPDSELPDGDYTVTATATDDAGNTGTDEVAFTVDSGTAPEELCAVGDFVWDDTNGDGLQDAGEPGVEGVTVELLNPDGSPANDADGNPVPATTTDGNGGYFFDNLTCDDYAVQFTAPAGSAFTAQQQGDDPTVDSNSDTTGRTPVFSVGPDDPDSVPNDNPDIAADFGNPTIDAGLVDAQDGDGVVGDFVWLDVNEDGIQDPDEPGVQDATVTLFRAADDSEVDSTTTDAGGSYAFGGLDFDDYYVVFEAPVDQPDLEPTVQSAGDDPAVDSDPDDTGQTPVFTVDETTTPDDTIDAGYIDQVAPTVEITSPSEGETTGDSTPTIEGTVDDPTSDVVVTVTDSDGNVVFEGPATVNDDGTWSVTPDGDFPDGDYTATVTATDPAGNTGTDEVAFTVDSTQPTDELCAVGDYVWDDTNGDGIQDAGEPGVEGVTVELLNPDGSPASDADGNPVPAATTDADGLYMFDNLACGDYMVQFTAPDGRTFTDQQQGDDRTVDSNPDATGDTPVFTVAADDPDTIPNQNPDVDADFGNQTIDAGLVDSDAATSEPSLTVEIAVPSGAVTVGDVFLVEVSVENTGDVPVGDLETTIEFADNVEAGECVDGHWDCRPGTVIADCVGMTAQPGDSYPDLQVQFEALSPGQSPMTATVRGRDDGEVIATAEFALDIAPSVDVESGAQAPGSGPGDLARTGSPIGLVGALAATLAAVAALGIIGLKRRRFGDRMDG